MKSRHGYAFPMALAAIAIIALVVTAAAHQVQRSNALISAIGDEFPATLGARSAEETVLYNALTSPMGARGIEVGGRASVARLLSSGPSEYDFLIPADGSPLRFRETVVRYIDQQGLANVATMQPQSIENLMTVLSVPRNARRQLAANLIDYQDQDDRPQFGGAESGQYPGSSRPSNQRLNSPMELCNVLGWSTLDICAEPGRLLLLTEARPLDVMNIRFASPGLLRQIASSAEEAVEWSAQIRERQIQNFAQIGHADLDQSVDFLNTIAPPSSRLVLITHDPDVSFAWRSSFELTPQSVIAPFSLHHRYRIEGSFVREVLEVESDAELQTLP